MIDNEIRQAVQRKREKDAMENSLYMYERALENSALVELRVLAVERGLVVKGRSKAVYINALIEAQRTYLEASKSTGI